MGIKTIDIYFHFLQANSRSLTHHNYITFALIAKLTLTFLLLNVAYVLAAAACASVVAYLLNSMTSLFFYKARLMIISFLIVYHKTNANNFEESAFSLLSSFSKTALVLCEFADGKAVKTVMDKKRYKKVSI